jgi:hypothetical protein
MESAYWDHGQWDHLVNGINFSKVFKASVALRSTVSQPKCVSVNGIIWLMESVCVGPKVMPLRGAHCNCKAFLTEWYIVLAHFYYLMVCRNFFNVVLSTLVFK